MTLTPKMNIWTEALLACSVACLVLILPSIVDDELMNGTQSGKFFFFIYSLLGILIFWSVGLLFKKELNFHFTIIDLLLALLVGWVSLNKYLLHDVHALSLRYFELLGLFILYVIVRSVDRKYYTLFLVAICFAGLVQAVYGNLQLWGFYPSHHGLFKMTGSFFNPGPYAGFLCCIFPIGLGLYWGVDKELENKAILNFKLQVSSFKFLMRRVDHIDKHKEMHESYLDSEAQHATSNFIPLIIKYLSLITIVTILLVLPAARSRAAWLGAIAGVVYLAWHKYNLNLFFKRHPDLHRNQTFKLFKHIITIRNRTIVAILTLLLVTASLSLYHYKKDSADGRLLIWTVMTNMIKDHPLLGVGQDMFKAHYMDYQADYFRNHSGSKYEMVADDNQYAFNEFMNIWTENGLVGLVLAGGLVWTALFSSSKFQVSGYKFAKGDTDVTNTTLQSDLDVHIDNLNRSESLTGEPQPETCNLQPETILRSSLLTILVFGMFAYPSEILPIKMTGILCLGLLSNMVIVRKSICKSTQPATCNPQPVTCKLKLLTIAATLLLCIVAFPKIKDLKEAYTTWNDAFELYNYRLNTECLEDYQKALPLQQHNGEFLINYGKALCIAEKYKDAVEILGQAKSYQINTVLCTAFGDSQKALKQYESAEKNYWQASNMAPCKFYPQYLLAKLYDDTYQQQKAVDIATSILKKEIKVESTAIKEIHDEMEKIIKRNTDCESQLISNEENTDNGQIGRNNYTSPQKSEMVTLPTAHSINKSSTTCGILKNRKEVR